MRTDKEYSREKKLSYENKRLKKEIAKLRKELARLDLDRYSQVKEIIEQHYQEDQAKEAQNMLDKMKEAWRCYQCEKGFLEIIIFNKLDSTWYLRKCNNCPNRTRSQRYTPQVKGIVKND